MSFIEINQSIGESQCLLLFIVSILSVWLVLVVYSLKMFGLNKTIRYFLPIMIIGLFVESGGVANGNYFYPGYFLYFNVIGGAVPLIIVMGWGSNLFLFLNMSACFIKKLYKKHNILQFLLISLFAGIFGICFDLLQDPVAHQNKWWVWTGGSSSSLTYYGVPIWNFRGWFVLISIMAFTTILIDTSGYTEKRKLILSLTSTAVVGGIIFTIRIFFNSIGF
jgi:uncharacterized membrane protein